LLEAEAGVAFDDLLAELRATVIPNLRRFPRIGRRYLDNPPQLAEALAQLAELPVGAPDALHNYLHGDYVMLYTVVEASASTNPRFTCSPSGTTGSCRSTSQGCGPEDDGGWRARAA